MNQKKARKLRRLAKGNKTHYKALKIAWNELDVLKKKLMADNDNHSL